MANKVTWYDTPGDSIVGYAGGFEMFRIRPIYGKGFFNFKVEGYVVRTEMKQESGRTFGYMDIETLEAAKEKAEEMWVQMLEQFNAK